MPYYFEPMSDLMTDQMKRLYEAAKVLRRTEGKSAVARLMNVSPQVLANWEKGRPISDQGLLQAQESIGCDALWLRDGLGEMVRGGPARDELLSLSEVMRMMEVFGRFPTRERGEVLRLMDLYRQCDGDGRDAIQSMAKSAARLASAINQAAND